MKTIKVIAAVIASAMFTINANAESKDTNEANAAKVVEVAKSANRSSVQTMVDGELIKHDYILDNEGRVVNKVASRWSDENSDWVPVSAYSVVYTDKETVLSYAKYNSFTKTYSTDVKQTRYNASEFPIIIRLPEYCK